MDGDPAGPAQVLAEAEDRLERSPVVIGFDGFVDESIRIVGQRTDPERFDPVATIGDYGTWVSASAGRSGLREFVVEDTMAGGCAVHTGDGLATLGVPIAAFAGLGDPPNPVFTEFMSKWRSVDTVGMEPGRSIVTEFDDGKLMLSSVSHFARFTPEHLSRHLTGSDFAPAVRDAAAIVLTSWSVYPYMTACWRFLIDDVLPQALSDRPDRPRFFFDLADPASRSNDDIVAMVDTIGGFERHGPVTLSLNGAEANRLAAALGIEPADRATDAGPTSLERLAGELRERAAIGEVEIHLVDRATTVAVDGTATVDGPYHPRPVRSVGAGDRFNAGMVAGLLLQLGPLDRLIVAAAASGFYVRNARSPSRDELVDTLRRWADDNLDS